MTGPNGEKITARQWLDTEDGRVLARLSMMACGALVTVATILGGIVLADIRNTAKDTNTVVDSIRLTQATDGRDLSGLRATVLGHEARIEALERHTFR